MQEMDLTNWLGLPAYAQNGHCPRKVKVMYEDNSFSVHKIGDVEGKALL